MSKSVFIPVVMGSRSARSCTEGAMIYEEPGDSYLSVLRATLAEEARLQKVEPDEAWLRSSTKTVLRLYEEAYVDYRNSPREKGVVGFVHEFELPSGTQIVMAEPAVMPKAMRVVAVREQHTFAKEFGVLNETVS